jgi:hypothetical protein
MEVGRDFQKRWHATPEAIRQQVFSELNSICKLLEPVTNLAEWQVADQARHEQQQKLVDEALEEIRLHELARIAAEKQLAERRRLEEEQAAAAALAAQREAEALAAQRAAEELAARQLAEALAAQQAAEALAAQQAEEARAEAEAQARAEAEAARLQEEARIQAEQQAAAAAAINNTAHLRQQLLDDAGIYIDLLLEQQKQHLTEWATLEIDRLLAKK